jgi:hypothetical protein
MKCVNLRIIGLLTLLWASSPPPVSGGFGDILKDAQKVLGGGGSISEAEIVKGLKEALQIGTGNAVKSVSKVNGFYKNPKIQIPLPGPVKKVESLLRASGFDAQVDAFLLSMNRAAERATPEAKTLFWDAIKQMNFDDARKILNGRDNEATLYFKDKTSDRLQEIFKPIVGDAMSEVGVTRAYKELDAKVKSIPFADRLNFDLDQYVTEGSLDGLFTMLAEEEKKIRQDPAARVTDLLKKVFGGK